MHGLSQMPGVFGLQTPSPYRSFSSYVLSPSTLLKASGFTDRLGTASLRLIVLFLYSRSLAVPSQSQRQLALLTAPAPEPSPCAHVGCVPVTGRLHQPSKLLASLQACLRHITLVLLNFPTVILLNFFFSSSIREELGFFTF